MLSSFQRSFVLSWSTLFAAAALLAMASGCTGCEEDLAPGDCPSGQMWHDQLAKCVDIPDGGFDDTWTGPTNSGTNQGGSNDNQGGGPCQGLECDVADCPSGQSTTLTGTVTIPSGQLPLPNVTVFVPNASLDPLPTGVSCARCDEVISGDPVVQTTTDARGEFTLEDVPSGQNIPVVMQTGKWRRQVEISSVQECTNNPITDTDLTRLPRNQSEGDIPRIAITTGPWDSLECLVYKIGLDDHEFTNGNDDSGAVTLYHGQDYRPFGSTDYATQEFAPGFQGGASLTPADPWWNQLSNLQAYDTVLHSCDYPDADFQAKQALQEFADMGGRVFMTDLHRDWLEFGTADFQSVANWQMPVQYPGVDLDARIDTSAPGAGQMYDWMDFRNRLSASGEFNAQGLLENIGSVDASLADRWIYTPYSTSAVELDLYFAFNTPVGAPDDQQCGRVVYSDLHVASAGGSEAGVPFPDGCSTQVLTPQEEVLIYMFFDLTACIDPDCIPLSCSDVPESCGVHDDGCGGTIDCGEDCCVEIDEPCTVDEDCCDTLWCEDGFCTDRCRLPGEPCEYSAQCCSEVCDPSAGTDGECLEL